MFLFINVCHGAASPIKKVIFTGPVVLGCPAGSPRCAAPEPCLFPPLQRCTGHRSSTEGGIVKESIGGKATEQSGASEGKYQGCAKQLVYDSARERARADESGTWKMDELKDPIEKTQRGAAETKVMCGTAGDALYSRILNSLDNIPGLS